MLLATLFPDGKYDQKPATTPIPVQLSGPEFITFIVPHLSMPMRGLKCKLGYHRVFNLILWVLKTGMQWEMHAGTESERRDRPDPLHDHLQGTMAPSNTVKRVGRSTGKRRIQGRRGGSRKGSWLLSRDSFRFLFVSGDTINRLAVNLNRPPGKLEADYSVLAGVHPRTTGTDWRHTLDLPDRGAVARLASVVR